MRNASASSGVGVRIARSLSKDLTAAEATVHRLACTRTTLTAAEQTEVGVQKAACSSEGRYKAVRIALPAHFRAGAPEAPQLPG